MRLHEVRTMVRFPRTFSLGAILATYVAFALAIPSDSLQAQGTLTGRVAARGRVLRTINGRETTGYGMGGSPTLFFYPSNGGAPAAVTQDPTVYPISYNLYNAYVNRWVSRRLSWEQAHGPGSTETLTVAQYRDPARRCLGANGQPTTLPALRVDTVSVLVVKPEEGLVPCVGYVLDQSPLPSPERQYGGDVQSLLVRNGFEVVNAQPGGTYAYETAFFTPSSDGTCSMAPYAGTTDPNLQAFMNCRPSNMVDGGALKVWAPLQGVRIAVWVGTHEANLSTDAQGWYSTRIPLQALPPRTSTVAGFTNTHEGSWETDYAHYDYLPILGEVAFAEFNPRSPSSRRFFLSSRTRSTADGVVIFANFAVDTVVFSVDARLVNLGPNGERLPVPMVGYDDAASGFTEFAYDRTRAPLGDQGLVEQISALDLQDTDVYLYRAGDEQLIGVRHGVNRSELAGRTLPDFPNATVPEGCADMACLSFAMMTRGPASRGTVGGAYAYRRPGLTTADSTGNRAQLDVEADYAAGNGNAVRFLREGDPVRIVAINRATGYLATADATVVRGQSGTATLVQRARATDVDPTRTYEPGRLELTLVPPNLRVEVHREYTVEYGATRGEERNYLVGFEGSSLDTDKEVQVTTDWYAEDGRPLPAELPGYTGRLARVSGQALVPAATSSSTGGQGAQPDAHTALFPIQPGHKLQILRLPERLVDRAHYYVHVDGAPLERTVDFAGHTDAHDEHSFSVNEVCRPLGGHPDQWVCVTKHAAESGPLRQRPAEMVPFLVANYDKTASDARRRAFLEQGLDDPGPLYVWHRSPEMQFTVASLDMRAMELARSGGGSVDLLHQPTLVGATDTAIDLSYLLSDGPDNPLPRLGSTWRIDANGDGIPELVVPSRYAFVFGGTEVEVVLDSSGRAEFVNPGQVNAVDDSGMLAMRLLQSGDEANVLWEYAFPVIQLSPGDLSEPLEVPADGDLTTTFYASILNPGSDEEEREYTVRWTDPCAGTVVEPAGGQEVTSATTFQAKVVLPATAGAKSCVVLEVDDGTGPVRLKGQELVVIPGQPYSVEWQTQGATTVGGIGEIAASIDLFDRFHNEIPNYAFDVSVSDVELTADTPVTDANGHAEVKFKGSDEPGTMTVAIDAGDLHVERPLVVQPVTLTWQAPEVMLPGRRTHVTLQATSPGVDLTGLQIQVSAYRGSFPLNDQAAGGTNGDVSFPQAVIQGNSVTLDFVPGVIPGQGHLFALIGGVNVTHDFQVAGVGGMEIENAVLVGDATSDGYDSFVTDGGQTIRSDYFVSSTVRLHGTPGENAVVSLGSAAHPARVAVAELPLDDVYADGLIHEAAQGLVARASDVLTEACPDDAGHHQPPQLGSCLRFGGATSRGLVVADASLDLASRVSFGLYVRPTSGGSVARLGQRWLGVSLEGTNGPRFVATAKTVGGEVRVESAVVTLGHWHEVGVLYDAGKLALEVDGVRTEVAATGELLAVPPAQGQDPASLGLVVGEGFVGHASDLRVHDLREAPHVSFAGGASDADVTFNAQGIATVTVTTSGTMARRHGARIPGHGGTLARAGEGGRSSGFFSVAHAQTTSNDCAAPTVRSGVTRDEARMGLHEYVSQCRGGRGSESHDAQIFQRLVSGGQIVASATIRVISRALNTYLQGYATLGNLVVDCLRGVFLDGKANATQIACSVASGIIGLGDVMDIGWQSYYMFLDSTQGCPQEGCRFSKAAFWTAVIGLIGKLMVTVAAPVAAAVTAATTPLKAAIGILRMARELVSLERFIIVPLANALKQSSGLVAIAQRLKPLLPAIEIVASIGLMYLEKPEMFRRLWGIIRETRTFQRLEALASWTGSVYDALSNGQPPDSFEEYTAAQEPDPNEEESAALERPAVGAVHAQAGLLIRSAMRGTLDLLDDFVDGKVMGRIASEADSPRLVSEAIGDAASMASGRSREVLVRTGRGVHMLHALVKLRVINGAEAVDAVKAVSARAGREPFHGAAGLMDDIADIPDELVTSQNSAIRDGMRQVIARLKAPYVGAQRGAWFEIQGWKWLQNTSAIQESVPVIAGLWTRVYDAVAEVPGLVGRGARKVDFKCWNPEWAAERVLRALRGGSRSESQIFRDLFLQIRTGRFDVTWVFDGRMTPQQLEAVKAAMLRGIRQPDAAQEMLRTIARKVPDAEALEILRNMGISNPVVVLRSAKAEGALPTQALDALGNYVENNAGAMFVVLR